MFISILYTYKKRCSEILISLLLSKTSQLDRPKILFPNHIPLYEKVTVIKDSSVNTMTMTVSHINKSISVHFFNDTYHTLASITGHSRLSANFTLTTSEKEKAVLIAFLSMNLLFGNLFRFLVLRHVSKPSALVKPINQIIMVDELFKSVG